MNHRLVIEALLFFIDGLCDGLSIWLGIKIVDKENKKNTIIKALFCGLIIEAIYFIPSSSIVTYLLILIFLSFVFYAYDLKIGEAIRALIVIVIAHTILRLSAAHLFIQIYGEADLRHLLQ